MVLKQHFVSKSLITVLESGKFSMRIGNSQREIVSHVLTNNKDDDDDDKNNNINNDNNIITTIIQIIIMIL